MFKIQPVQTLDDAATVANACGSRHREGLFVYSMRDAQTDEIMGFSQFEITGEYGYIYDLKPKIGLDDYEAMFILGRATMNFIDTCGVHICRASLSAGDALLMRGVGFKEKDGEYYADMTNFFNGKCHEK